MSTIFHCISLPSNPLFSSIVTLYILIFLYFPHILLKIVISPVIISTFILLLYLLRLGASQQLLVHKDPHEVKTRNSLEPEPVSLEHDRVGVHPTPHCSQVETQASTEPDPKTRTDQEREQLLVPSQGAQPGGKPHCNRAEPDPWPEPGYEAVWGSDTNRFFEAWDVGAPLEVIYEVYEGEEEEEEGKNDAFDDQGNLKASFLDKYPSLSKYYPETDSDSGWDSDSDSDCSREFPAIEQWDDHEDEREGLIEIALDNYHGIKRYNKEVVNFDDEDNLIEIDISPTRNTNHAFS